MRILEKPALTPEERKLPLSRFYDIPMYEIGPLYQQLIDKGPLKEEECLPIEHWLDHLQLPGIYNRPVFGYRVLNNSRGYVAAYSTYPNCTPAMMRWWFHWINVPCKSQPDGVGNIKYKIWGPPGHFFHKYVNGKDRTDGIMVQESLDFLQRPGTVFGQQILTVRYDIDMKQFGMTDEKLNELRNAGIWIDPAVERFYNVEEYYRTGKLVPALGTHIMLTMSRACVLGGMEKMTLEWFGYDLQDGKFVFNNDIPEYKLTDEWLRMALVHATAEAQQLNKFLPELYAEYSVKPDDAD